MKGEIATAVPRWVGPTSPPMRASTSSRQSRGCFNSVSDVSEMTMKAWQATFNLRQGHQRTIVYGDGRLAVAPTSEWT